ncbi:hypothetical protein OPV22_024227 [Ensete ventricosum]|uniref:C2H2-type domain-containing protein n=1 Tax=Ensete ventricosum TaxID=4639 RepID=A0AAV8PDR1_ENSVE|nr:hypothetical protein OPV22_024227 [Ensete ventricosum]
MLGSPSLASEQPSGGAIVSSTTPQPLVSINDVSDAKKKRRPVGTPDPDAEIVALSPRALLESERYVCAICNQGFQRDQNLQMHQRRHKVPWKLLKREASEVRKRVYVCPETTCLHHDPRHALGDLVGIKKHFRRKHSSHRQWVCDRCSKAYAVQSDYKAHLKTCGTRGHSCDCGRVFSRVESFIEHQGTCAAGRARAELHMSQPPVYLSRMASSPSPSSDTNFSPMTWPVVIRTPNPTAAVFLTLPDQPSSAQLDKHCTRNVELQLLPPSGNQNLALSSSASSPATEDAEVTKLQISIGPAADHAPAEDQQLAATRLKDETLEQLKLAMTEKALADEARHHARKHLGLAQHEFETAKRIRQRAQLELNRAYAIREHALKQINSTLIHITCYACKRRFPEKPAMASEENSFVVSYMSSVVTEGEEENEDHNHQQKISKS